MSIHHDHVSDTPSTPDGPERCRALVVYESMFGNTEQLAHAVAEGLRLDGLMVDAVDVGEAPSVDGGVDLLVVGAPTHAFSLSRPRTRADAVRQGAPAVKADHGLREWLTSCGGSRETDVVARLAVFDTRVTQVRHLPKAAGRKAARLGERQGYLLIAKPASFLVEDVKGPLLEGELDRAVAWGRHLGGVTRIHVAALRARSSSR